MWVLPLKTCKFVRAFFWILIWENIKIIIFPIFPPKILSVCAQNLWQLLDSSRTHKLRNLRLRFYTFLRLLDWMEAKKKCNSFLDKRWGRHSDPPPFVHPKLPLFWRHVSELSYFFQFVSISVADQSITSYI